MSSNIAMPSSFNKLSEEEVEYDGGLSGNDKLGIVFATIGGAVFLTGLGFAIKNGVMMSRWKAGAASVTKDTPFTTSQYPGAEFSRGDCLYQAGGYKDAMCTSLVVAGAGAAIGGGIGGIFFATDKEVKF